MSLVPLPAYVMRMNREAALAELGPRESHKINCEYRESISDDCTCSRRPLSDSQKPIRKRSKGSQGQNARSPKPL